MNKAIKNIAIAVCAATTILSLAACGSSTSNSDKSSTVSFQTWNLKNDTYTPYFNSLIKEFEKDNPGITIKWVDQPAENYDQKLSTDAAAGQLPDVVNVSEQQGYNLAKSGMLLNLSKEAPTYAKDYLSQAWNGSTFQGNGINKGVYGFPWYMNINVAYINTSAFRQCGLDPKMPPTDYEQYFEQGRKFSDNCKGKLYWIGIPWMLPSEFNEYGANFLSANRSRYTFNNAKGVEFITQYKQLYNERGFPEDGLNTNTTTAEKLYFQGNVAYMRDSTSSVASFKANAPDLYSKLTAAPLATNTKNTLDQMTIGISSQTKNKKMAIKFAHFVTNKKNQLEFSKKSNTFPSAAGAMDDTYFTDIDTSTLEGQVLAVAKKEIENGTVANFPPEISDSDGANYLSPSLVKALKGEMSVKAALDEAAKSLDGRLGS